MELSEAVYEMTSISFDDAAASTFLTYLVKHLFITQLFLFIIFMAIFEAYPPGEPRWSWLYSLAGELLLLLALALGLRALAWRRRQRKAGNARFIMLAQIISILGLLFFCTCLDFKALLHTADILRNWETLNSLLLAFLFFLHLSIAWWAARPLEPNGPGWLARVLFIVPMVFPWFLATLARDGLQTFWQGGKAFLQSEAGYLVFLLFFLALMFVLLPPLMKHWWRCRPLQGEIAHELQAILDKSRVKVAAICNWPILGSRALTAAMLGMLPRLRYLLITPALINTLSMPQLEAVVAHEAGHLRYRHMLLYTLLFLGYLVVLFALSAPLNAFLNFWLYLMAGTQTGTDLILQYGSKDAFWSVVFSLPMLLALLLYLRFVLGFFMRHAERQADFFALDIMQSPEPLCQALERIADLSGGNMRNAPSWHHFSIAQRVDALRSAQAGQAAATQGRFIKRASVILCLAFVVLGATGWWVGSLNLDSLIRGKTLERLHENNKAYHLRASAAEAWRAGRQRQAIAIMRSALTEDDNDAQNMNNLSYYLIHTREADLVNREQALDLAGQATRLAPGRAEYWDVLADACYANQLYPQAAENARAALREAKDDDHDYYQRRLDAFVAIEKYQQAGEK